MATDVYLKINGIKGESKDSAHEGWIEITSAHWGVVQPRSATASTAGGHTAERCEHHAALPRELERVTMRSSSWLILASAAAALTLAGAADLAGDPSGLWKPFPAIFKIHSGVVADRTPPTARDRKLTVNVDGAAARELFDSIGPDVEPICNGDKGDRDRRRKGIYCTYDPADVKAKGGPYRCWIGVNLVTGEAENNVSC